MSHRRLAREPSPGARKADSPVQHRRGATVRDMVGLQRLIGNRSVNHLLGAGGSAEQGTLDQLPAGSGRTLEEPTLTLMERQFQHGFSDVRIHTDAGAATSASALSARAYTVGNHVYFGAQAFRPATRAGAHLLAHELAHVVQQRGGPGPSARTAGIPISDPGDPLERQAEAVADDVVRQGIDATDAGR